MHDFEALGRTAAGQFGVLTKRQLHKSGLSQTMISDRVKSGLFRRLAGGLVAIASSPDCLDQRIAAAALAALPLGGASVLSASRLWQFRDVDDDVEVSIRYPRQLRLPGVVVHRSVDLTFDDLTWISRIPVTTPVRTICDLGLRLPEHEVSRILRHQVATGRLNRRDVQAMRYRIGKPGRNGAGIIGRCLDDLPVGTEVTESGIEAQFLAMCDDFGVPRPVIQLPVVALGKHYRLDFAYPALRIFIEIDGKAHGEDAQIANDDFRQNNLVACGWHPVRFTSDQLKSDPATCAATITHLLRVSDEIEVSQT